LQQVILNLILNAVEAMGSIKISAQFFSRAYLKYNITSDAGSVDQPRPLRSASRLTGATVFHRFYILCNAA
ncbi:MAG: hypothetical protein WB689_01580, partial [Xanthobacteraceae bacterium]